ncbi:unnamed protein product [Arabis nemorensis]|uniref:Transmembrane protein n=1 Tax=Arabis nemorensis TaxID=586526 RepID=A0A565ALI2_9BRAS|nr:unnamed protein product [Arabis nemorensis]
MGLRRTLLVLYILLIFHIRHFPTVSSRPSSVDTNHETLPFNDSKPDVVGFEGKTPELAFVIKKGARGGRSKGGAKRGGRRRWGDLIPRHGGGARGRSHRSSASRNLQGEMSVVGWLGFSVLAGLFLA